MKTTTSPVPMAPVSSSQVHSIGYDAGINVLHVYFPKMDKKEVVGVASHYSYPNFPADKFQQFMDAESKGSFFIHQVKNAKVANDRGEEMPAHPHFKHEPTDD